MPREVDRFSVYQPLTRVALSPLVEPAKVCEDS